MRLDNILCDDDDDDDDDVSGLRAGFNAHARDNAAMQYLDRFLQQLDKPCGENVTVIPINGPATPPNPPSSDDDDDNEFNGVKRNGLFN